MAVVRKSPHQLPYQHASQNTPNDLLICSQPHPHLAISKTELCEAWLSALDSVPSFSTPAPSSLLKPDIWPKLAQCPLSKKSASEKNLNRDLTMTQWSNKTLNVIPSKGICILIGANKSIPSLRVQKFWATRDITDEVNDPKLHK